MLDPVIVYCSCGGEFVRQFPAGTFPEAGLIGLNDAKDIVLGAPRLSSSQRCYHPASFRKRSGSMPIGLPDAYSPLSEYGGQAPSSGKSVSI